LHTLTSLLGLAAWLVAHGRTAQVWHVHQYGVHATLAVLLGKLLRRPVVLKLTSSGPQGLGATLAALRFGALHRWAHRRVAACIAVSKETAREAVAFGLTDARVRTIGNGVDVDAFRPVTPEQRSSGRRSVGLPEGFVGLAVGRLASEKNPLGLLQAWMVARSRLGENAKLVFVGDGPLRREMETAIVNLGLVESVVLPGQVADVCPWLTAADVFVLASHNEGLANTLLEAMACGLPSVATAVSGTSQLLVQTSAGIVVPIGDMQALAEALVTLAQDAEARLAIGQRARAAVVANYSLSATSAQVEALYVELLRGR
jgi:glycosyltransferase involved in cell wall biosynthesis